MRSARALGLLTAEPTAIAPSWRALWWAISEVGTVDERLLGHLERTMGAPSERGLRRQLTALCERGWLSHDRPPGRPSRLVVLTARGRANTSRPELGPAWTAPAREVVRRGLATALHEAEGPVSATRLEQLVTEHADRWGRVARPADIRMELLSWRRRRLIRYLPPRPRHWVSTELGRKVFRAVARAAEIPLPRRPVRRDTEHEDLVLRAVLAVATVCPALLTAFRLDRRIYLDQHRQSWVLPDGLVGARTRRGVLLLALEVERRGRYEGLVRHLTNYQTLARSWRVEVAVAVVSSRVTAGRREVVASAVAQPSDRSVLLSAAALTVRSLEAWLDSLGVDSSTTGFGPNLRFPR